MEDNEEKGRPWHFDQPIKPSFANKKQRYVLIQAGEKDLRRVAEYYSVCPVPGYEIGSIEIVYNPKMLNKFELHLEQLQEKDGNSAFIPDWEKEDKKAGKSTQTIAWRAEISARLDEISSPYKVSAYPAVKLLPLWHGTDPNILDSIFRTGYANLSKTDDGFFGKGLYFTPEPSYANRVYGKGALLINWIGCFAAYPVIDGDMPKLRGRGNYSQYDAHFVPVVPASNSPNEISYYPTKSKEKAIYNELVVFQEAAALPWGIVHLQAILLKQLPEKQNPEELLYAQKNITNASVDKKGNTALHLAIKQKKSQEYLQTLMEQGADCKIRNKKGKRPIDIASEETKLFLVQQHKTLKKMSMLKLEVRINRLEQKINALEPEAFPVLQVEENPTTNTISNKRLGI